LAESKKRVVITGIGIVCPLGANVEDTWTAAKKGASGAGPITRFDATDYETTFAAEVKDFDADAIVGKKESRRMDRYTQFAVAAALEAARQACLTSGAVPGERMGAFIGTGMGGVETIENGAETLLTKGPRRLGPFFVPMILPNMASGAVAIAIGSKGPNFAPTSACASAGHAIGEATLAIRRGSADVMLAGGAEAPISRLGVAGFNAMGALSTRNNDPQGASRPFDAGRDGFVLGEGGAVLVLEDFEHANARGAKVLGEVHGYGTTDDANHIVQPGPGGEGAARAIGIALEDAGIDATEIDYINAHGTSTQLNEKLETEAIKRAFGDHAYGVPISSTKSMTGHLLGAAGSVEAAFCLLAIRDQCLPPTINYETPDPDCDLDYIPNVARSAQVNRVLSNSMGFGGHNVALIFGSGK
jgi:3-oxoacyl-[acyl-carrier-protein] synthase II